MFLYRTLDGVFPRSYPAKIFFVAFIGTHVPLIAVVAYVLAQSGPLADQAALLLVVLGATLVGCAATLAAIWALLAPIRRTQASIAALETETEPTALPEGFRDALGDLMRLTNRMVGELGHRLSQARDAALTDPLTGLWNRRGFSEMVPADAVGAVLCLDVDNFKQINDSLGHATGDDVLRRLAAILTSTARDQDVVARTGGEEFTAWLPGASARNASDTAERLRQAVEAGLRVDGRAVTVSIGVDGLPGRAATSQRMERADAALYVAKRGGRNRVVLSQGHAAAPTGAAPTGAATRGAA